MEINPSAFAVVDLFVVEFPQSRDKMEGHGEADDAHCQTEDADDVLHLILQQIADRGAQVA